MEVDDKRLARLVGKNAEPTDTQDVDHHARECAAAAT